MINFFVKESFKGEVIEASYESYKSIDPSHIPNGICLPRFPPKLVLFYPLTSCLDPQESKFKNVFRSSFDIFTLNPGLITDLELYFSNDLS